MPAFQDGHFRPLRERHDAHRADCALQGLDVIPLEPILAELNSDREVYVDHY